MSSKTHKLAGGSGRPAKRDPRKLINWIGMALVVAMIAALFYGVLFRG
jgi:hypothetical protein